MDNDTIKAELMKMAENGNPRPNVRKCQFGKHIWDFTSQKSRRFDLEFSNKLRKTAPHWFVFASKKERQEKRKEFQSTLLRLAMQGFKTPKGTDRKLSKLLWEYTNKKSKNYDFRFTQELRRIAPEWISCSKEEELQKLKIKLLQFAASGNPKPKWRDRPFGYLMQKFTTEKSPSYDHEFIQKLHETAPHWFSEKAKSLKKSNSKDKKDAILNLALSGEPRPNSKKSENGKLIWVFTSPKSKRYDQKFAEELKQTAPHWFNFLTVESKKEKSQKEKEFLLSVAKSGIPRPNDRQKSKEARLLKRFIHPSSKSFDAKLKLELEKCAPHWFEDLHPNKRNTTKNLLISMAKNGEPKPTYRQDSLGKKLSDFTDIFGKQYDPKFTEEIKKIAPTWLRKKTDLDKELLLKLAAEGSPKPIIRKSSIGLKLSRFTNPRHQCFDSDFNEKIRKIRPEWFGNRTVWIKAKLYEMALTGKPRPEQDSALARRLSEYVRIKSERYDETFANKIKTLAPHWFTRGKDAKK